MSFETFLRFELMKRNLDDYMINYYLSHFTPDIIVRDFNIEVTDEEYIEYLKELDKLFRNMRR